MELAAIRAPTRGMTTAYAGCLHFFIERPWCTLKSECVYLHVWETGSETKAAVRKCTAFYNHPALSPDGKPPTLVYWQRTDIH